MRYWDDYKDHELFEVDDVEEAEPYGRLSVFWLGERVLGQKVYTRLPTSQVNYDPITKTLSLPVWLAMERKLI